MQAKEYAAQQNQQPGTWGQGGEVGTVALKGHGGEDQRAQRQAHCRDRQRGDAVGLRKADEKGPGRDREQANAKDEKGSGGRQESTSLDKNRAG